MERPSWEDEFIDVSSEQEIERWCKILKCQKADLFFAIGIVGTSAEFVNEILILNRRTEDWESQQRFT